METADARVSAGLTDDNVIELWLHRQPSPLTRSCYKRDINRLLKWSGKGLLQICPFDLERFAGSLADSGLASISQGRIHESACTSQWAILADLSIGVESYAFSAATTASNGLEDVTLNRSISNLLSDIPTSLFTAIHYSQFDSPTLAQNLHPQTALFL